jgi:phosphoribosylformimino-5-aminoimidazole carboxamide ribotide isomerase
MTRHMLQYSGGVVSLDDLRRVRAAGAEAVILGKALYEGRVKLEEVIGT